MDAVGACFKKLQIQEGFVSKICDICGKKPMVGSHISHAHNITKRRFNPNLQRVRTVAAGCTKTLVVCTACLKSGRVQKAP